MRVSEHTSTHHDRTGNGLWLRREETRNDDWGYLKAEGDHVGLDRGQWRRALDAQRCRVLCRRAQRAGEQYKGGVQEHAHGGGEGERERKGEKGKCGVICGSSWMFSDSVGMCVCVCELVYASVYQGSRVTAQSSTVNAKST